MPPVNDPSSRNRKSAPKPQTQGVPVIDDNYDDIPELKRIPRRDQWRNFRAGTKGRKFVLVVLFVISIMFLDLGFARVHYHYHINRVSSMREIALDHMSSGTCPDESLPVVDANETNCSVAACQSWALKLAQERQAALHFVRNSHPVGGWLAAQFDNARGQSQDGKLERLLAQKQCTHLIDSSIRSNKRADMGSTLAFLLGLAGIVAVWGFW